MMRHRITTTILSAIGLLCTFSINDAKADLIDLSAGLPVSNYSASGSWPGTSPYLGFNDGRWNSGGHSGWLRVDLGQIYEVSSVEFVPAMSPLVTETRTDEIFAGTTLQNMTLVYNKPTYSVDAVSQTISFDPVLAEFIEIYVPYTNSWVGLNKVQVLGNVVTPPTSPSVPEPASFALLGTGLLGIGMALRRNRTAPFAWLRRFRFRQAGWQAI